MKENTYAEHVSEWLYQGLKVIRFPGGLLLHMQYKLYKPPAGRLGGTSNSFSCKPHFYFLKVLAGSLREGLLSGRFSPWCNWKCLQTLGKAATVWGGTEPWAAAWEISTAERKKRNGPSSALLLPESGESSLMDFFQEHFSGCFRNKVTEEAQGDFTVPALEEKEFPLHLAKCWQFLFWDKWNK